MKTLNNIPSSKLQRTSKWVQTGVKVGVNYIKYYGNKIVQTEEEATNKLNESNAEDIYNGLKELKGSALKVAQMLSMDKNMLPKAFVEKFSLSQFSVPPLSAALVLKSFKKYFKQSPFEVFDQFNLESVHAASIGQVHEAFKDNNKYAVKIQYPGVAESISSDLAIAKPLASRMFNMNSKEAEPYFKEVENKLLEETNYLLELEQSEQIAHACAHLNGIVFPKYYKKWSSDRILTMDWMDGLHLSEYVKLDNLSHRNSVGQALWDFYMYQIHHLKKVHADPHPGNFKVNDKHELVALDFGCMKTIPESFYAPYFELAFAKNINDPLIFEEKLYDLEILRKDDNGKEKAFFKDMFYQLLSVFTLPFQQETFDFSDHTFFDKVAELGEQYSKNADLKKMNANRGSEHFIYMNRTFFGLYQLMFDLKATHIKINNYTSLIN